MIPLFPMSSFIPTRFPRSLHESSSYDPAWRSLQVSEYLRCRRRAGEEGIPFVVPLSERDSLVRAFYKFRTGAPTPKADVCRYAFELCEDNDRTFMASRIKAMIIAGRGQQNVTSDTFNRNGINGSQLSSSDPVSRY